MTNARTTTQRKRNGVIETSTWSEDDANVTTVRTYPNGKVVTYVNGVRI